MESKTELIDPTFANLANLSGTINHKDFYQ